MQDRPARRAARLTRLYPRRWRRQYPDFEVVLAAELAEGRRGARRDAVRGAAVERLRAAGVLPIGPEDRARSGLTLIYAALVPFAALAMGMWSQLHTGISSRGLAEQPVLGPAELLLAIGTLVTAVCLPVGLALIVLRSSRRTPATTHASGTRGADAPRQMLLRAGALFLGAMVALTATGWAADRSGWYSPAALALPARGPGHVLTLWVRALVAAITPAWVHPSLFWRMPVGEFAAALAAPVVGLVAAVALMRMLAAVPLRTPGRADVAWAVSTVAMMLLSVAASVRWLLAHPARRGANALLARDDPLAPGHTGWAVVLLLVALAAAALIGTRQLLRGSLTAPTPSAWEPR